MMTQLERIMMENTLIQSDSRALSPYPLAILAPDLACCWSQSPGDTVGQCVFKETELLLPTGMGIAGP